MAPRSLLGTWLGITTSLAMSLQGRGRQGQAQPASPLAPYYYVQQTCTRVLYPALALARVCGEGGLIARTTQLAVLYGTAGLVGRWAAAPEPSFAFQITHPLGQPPSASELRVVFPKVDMPVFLGGAVCQDLLYTWTCARTRAAPAGLLPLSQPQRAKLS